MKLKDLHTNLEEEINLLKFRPKKEISVDSFLVDENIIKDVSKNKIKETIKLKQESKIRLKKISKKNNFDALNNIEIFSKIDLLKKSNKNYLPFSKGVPYFEVWKIWEGIIDKFSFNSFSKIPIFFTYLLLFIIIIFIDKLAIEHFTNNWYKKLLSLKNNSNLIEKQNLINSSNSDFKIAEILFIPFKIVPGEKINNANNVIIWGIKTTNLLNKISTFSNWIYNFIQEKWEENIAYSQLFKNSQNIFKYTEKELRNISKVYNKIQFSDNILLQNKLDYFKIELNKISYFINIINNNFDTFLDILWHNKRKKYLIVFQNNDEIRPQWGFMWSMWIVEIFRWEIKKFQKRDVYDYEFKIKKEYFIKELSPEWINKMTPYLWLRDSNYYINHKDSWNKIKFFIEKAGYNIDWIIYINQNSLFSILDLVWEYESKVLKTKVNSSNFSIIMSSLVESKKSQKWTLWTPKQILFDFMEEFKEVLKEKNISKAEILKSILKDIKNREIVFYNFDKKERELLKELSLFNPIEYNESLDFSYPVFTSISGNKSDRYIKTSYKKIITKWIKCEYKTSLEINLEHSFNDKDLENNKNILNKFWIKKDINKLLFIQWNWLNKQYVRIIVPKNAVIEKNNKILSVKKYYKRWKVIDFYLNTKVWEKSSFKLNYSIPNNECKIYNYKFYKQPWIRQYNLELDSFWNKRIFKNIKSDLFIN